MSRADRGHHYNYEIQAWITYGRVRGCAHPDNAVRPCCNGYRYRGLTESAAVAAFRKQLNPIMAALRPH